MLDKQAGKKRNKNAQQEVEMVQTSDGFAGNPALAAGGDGEAFAQPKGVQTRAAIARHLAAKLKIDDENMDPNAIFDQYNELKENERATGSKTYWDKAISNEREKMQHFSNIRLARLTSEQFSLRQSLIKVTVKNLVEENKHVKLVNRLKKSQSAQADILSDDSEDERRLATDESIYLNTGDLTKRLEKEKALGSKKKVKETYNHKYAWKVSVIVHRKRKQAWEVFIIMVALYSVFVIPIRLGINPQLLDPAYDAIDMITWVIYIIDVLINLRTTYIDNFGQEITNSGKVMRHYIGSFRFIVDLLSLANAPNLFVSKANESVLIVLNLLGLLKLSRYFRAQTLIVESRLKVNSKAQASCGFYFCLLLIYLHMIGCIFFFFCLQTYENSSTRIGMMQDMGLIQIDVNNTAFYPFPKFQPFYE